MIAKMRLLNTKRTLLKGRWQRGRNIKTDSIGTAFDANINMGYRLGFDIHAVIQKYAW